MKADQKAEQELTAKLKNHKHEATAKDVRALLDAKGKPTIQDKTATALESVQVAIKNAALAGMDYANINIGTTHHHPEVREAVEKALTKWGFKYEVQGINGYIYW